jgi:hypothetical protein
VILYLPKPVKSQVVGQFENCYTSLMTQEDANKNGATRKALELRRSLVQVSLEWERRFGVAPSVTSAISELDAALLVGMNVDAYCSEGNLRTAVSKDVDFVCHGIRYQVTANRPSGKKGSFVTLVSQKTEKTRPFGWERLIWILYDRLYTIQEAWEFTADEYRKRFCHLTRLSPDHMRQGRRLFPVPN